MTFEVELKFLLDQESSVVQKLTALNPQKDSPVHQCDTYFAHPARDFGSTDEAFRLRQVGDQNCVTYKGPIVDDHSKTRREIEISIADGNGAAGEWIEMMQLLGFEPVRAVEKSRTPMSVSWEDRQVVLALDSVTGLGNYLEMELIADEAGREAARDSLRRLADYLGLGADERRSYLRILMENTP